MHQNNLCLFRDKKFKKIPPRCLDHGVIYGARQKNDDPLLIIVDPPLAYRSLMAFDSLHVV